MKWAAGVRLRGADCCTAACNWLMWLFLFKCEIYKSPHVAERKRKNKNKFNIKNNHVRIVTKKKRTFCFSSKILLENSWEKTCLNCEIIRKTCTSFVGWTAFFSTTSLTASWGLLVSDHKRGNRFYLYLKCVRETLFSASWAQWPNQTLKNQEQTVCTCEPHHNYVKFSPPSCKILLRGKSWLFIIPQR